VVKCQDDRPALTITICSDAADRLAISTPPHSKAVDDKSCREDTQHSQVAVTPINSVLYTIRASAPFKSMGVRPDKLLVDDQNQV
jgi:hypothetical protein